MLSNGDAFLCSSLRYHNGMQRTRIQVCRAIHAMHELYKQRPMNLPSGGKKPTSQNDGGSFIKLKSPWKPSLEWEDFSTLARKGSSFKYCSNKNAITWVMAENPCIGSDQNMGVGRFDLNVEATAEE
ncbi:hypothetical protein SUGI_0029430 [Cryptomeria japonica]|nr:hypothetical protein SUGI_0029430 [Cryptomeria japonica]